MMDRIFSLLDDIQKRRSGFDDDLIRHFAGDLSGYADRLVGADAGPGMSSSA